MLNFKHELLLWFGSNYVTERDTKDLGITIETLEGWINEQVEIALVEKDKIKQLEAENRKQKRVIRSKGDFRNI